VAPVRPLLFSIRTRIAAAATGALLLLGAGGAWKHIRSSQAFFEPRLLLSRFPAEDALAVSMDVAALRNSGLLGASRGAIEPEYKQFLDGTGFDYRRDLDSVVASFSRSGNYFIARGRFDWTKLRDYAIHSGGACYQDLCRIQGSKPERHISFLPLRKDAIALAVSTNDLAATVLTKTGQPVTALIPSSPVWISVPGAELRRQDSLPPNLRLTLSALTTADRVLITVDKNGDGIEAHMEATCRTQDDARILASQFRSATGMLKDAFAREHSEPNDEIGALLTAGAFDQNGPVVTGTWPVRKSLLDALTSGI
jgi:hypothetical protein